MNFLFPEMAVPAPPETRYQGSKRKLLDWIWSVLREIEFKTVLDLFSGSGCVSHYLKGRGKAVTANDSLQSAFTTALAIVENDAMTLTGEEVDRLLMTSPHIQYDTVIERTFQHIYFTEEENRWLDKTVQNIALISNQYKQALAYYALFQAALVKRPYNLFHRKNLYMRLADVRRNFGNKATWDRPFDLHFRDFVSAGNSAVFAGKYQAKAKCQDAFDVQGTYDLVYIDPPYMGPNGVGVDYHDFYHFLDGLLMYSEWERHIDYRSKHRRLRPRPNPWSKPTTIFDGFRRLFRKFPQSVLVLSYRNDGIPSVHDLLSLLRDVRTDVRIYEYAAPYTYALSRNQRSTELLFVAKGSINEAQ